MKYVLMLLLLCPSVFAGEAEYKISILLEPVVKVSYKNGSGSGVIVYSEPQEEEFRTFILTNYHVIDDAISVDEKTGQETREFVCIRTYEFKEQGNKVVYCDYKAYIATHNKALDCALLELTDRSAVFQTARFLPKRLKIGLFQEVWNVGCPGGLPVNFSKGMITAIGYFINEDDVGDRATYIRTNSAIYFGNSGGATFAEVEGVYYFIGMPARIKSKVPYVNYSIDLDTIRGFLENRKVSFVEDPIEPVPDYVRPLEKPKMKDSMFEYILPFRH